MPLGSGTRLGPYQIVAPAGAGGMGEVYKCTDMRLGRTVAIKVLPAHVASDLHLKQRFEQEAKALATLSHPHICAVFDVGSQDGIDFLVMEYLEGQTLAERLQKGALSVEQTVEYAIEIADALDKAHRHGIVHRDLKPGNVMITRSGAKLLDFGLAKVRAGPVFPQNMSQAETANRELTAPGTLLGTMQYMAPEQLEGQEADARTDVFAFGALFYEMVTGRKAFEAKSQVGLMAAILEHEPPPITALQPVSPPILNDITRVCLAKNPDDRWQSAADLLHALKLAAAHTSGPAISMRVSKVRERAAWAVAAALALVLGITAARLLSPDDSEASRVTFDIDLAPGPAPLQISLAPDGTRLVQLVRDGLSIRRLDQVSAQTLSGTADARAPFWSADSRFLGFVAAGTLKKVDLFGSSPQTLAEAQGGGGGAWNRDGVIVFAPSPNGPLFRIPSEGGAPVQATVLDQSRGEVSHRSPKFLPDGMHFLFFAVSGKPENSGIFLGTLGSNLVKRLIATDVMGVFAPPDHLLFMLEDTLMAQRFDTRRLELRGDPFPVAEDVARNPTNHNAGITASDTGALAYVVDSRAISRRRLQWVDRAGKPLDAGAEGAYQGLGGRPVAPDGERVLATRLDGGNTDLWILDRSRAGTGSRFTYDQANDNNGLWSPDGSHIVFRSNRDGRFNLYQKDASGAQPEEPLLKSEYEKIPEDWSHDGKYLSYSERSPQSRWDTWILPMFGDRKPFLFLGVPSFDEDFGRFSPDVRWIAYRSNESGRSEIYVDSFPKRSGGRKVSTAGGTDPKWRSDGRELFYRTRRGDAASADALWAVDVDVAGPSSFKPGIPRKLFDANTAGFYPTPDGQRFLLNVPSTQEPETAVIRFELNWMSGRQ
jgi:serine/threonine protein kinase